MITSRSRRFLSGKELCLWSIHAIRDGGGFGSIIGRNSFQRMKPATITLLDTIMKHYAGKV